MSTTPQEGSPTLEVTDYAVTRQTWAAIDPARAYDLVSEVSNIGLWSPNAIRAEYDEGAGPWEGAWFRGRNRSGDNEWDSRSQVQRAERGVEFAYTVLGSVGVPIVRWRWTFTPHASGTVLTQTWQLIEADPVLGTTTAEVDALRDATAAGMEATLVAMASWMAENPAT